MIDNYLLREQNTTPGAVMKAYLLKHIIHVCELGP